MARSIGKETESEFVAATAILASQHFSMAFLLLHHASVILLVLIAAASLASSTVAFSPSLPRSDLGLSLAVRDKRNGINTFVLSTDLRQSSCLFSSQDGGIDGRDESEPREDVEENDEADIILQKLRRNAASGPINPVKEHDVMKKDNEDEAKSSTSANFGTADNGKSNGAPSTLYSYMLAKAVDPDFDPAASMDETYVETQMKRLLSRKGKELSRLGPGIATLPLEPASEEAKLEAKLSRKESQLQQVINEAKAAGLKEWDASGVEESRRAQSDILGEANKLQSEIDQLHVDDCGAVLIANLAFYEAFSLQDPEAMKNVWWHSPSVMCIHPSHHPLIGSNAVIDSFKVMFENGMKESSRIRGDGGNAAVPEAVFMTPTNIRAFSVRGSTASLVCDEEVYSKGSAGGSISGVLINKLLTTNVFRKIDGKWKMAHRHASWHPESNAAQQAIEANPGICTIDAKPDPRAKGMSLRRLNGDGTSTRPVGLPSIPPSLEGLDASAVLGIPMPKEEDLKKKSKEFNEDGVIGKIINLSDLLGGKNDSKNGEKDDDDKGIGDALADMLMGSAGSDSSHTTGSGTAEDPFITRRVIKIGPEGFENLIGKSINEDKKEDIIDDDEEQNIVIDMRGKSKEEQKDMLSQVVDNALKDAGLQLPSNDDAAASVLDTSVGEPSPRYDKQGIRQKCIATLRELSRLGLISSKQKRVLLTDIVTSSSRGETSMVEVAYELLVVGGKDESSGNSELDIGVEEFAEQCRVFAKNGDDDDN